MTEHRLETDKPSPPPLLRMRMRGRTESRDVEAGQRRERWLNRPLEAAFPDTRTSYPSKRWWHRAALLLRERKYARRGEDCCRDDSGRSPCSQCRAREL